VDLFFQQGEVRDRGAADDAAGTVKRVGYSAAIREGEPGPRLLLLADKVALEEGDQTAFAEKAEDSRPVRVGRLHLLFIQLEFPGLALVLVEAQTINASPLDTESAAVLDDLCERSPRSNGESHPVSDSQPPGCFSCSAHYPSPFTMAKSLFASGRAGAAPHRRIGRGGDTRFATGAPGPGAGSLYRPACSGR